MPLVLSIQYKIFFFLLYIANCIFAHSSWNVHIFFLGSLGLKESNTISSKNCGVSKATLKKKHTHTLGFLREAFIFFTPETHESFLNELKRDILRASFAGTDCRKQTSESVPT